MNILDFVEIYVAQMFVCSIINIVKSTRTPKSVIDFLKLTFFPWRLLHFNDKLN